MTTVEKATPQMFEDICRLFYSGEAEFEWQARVNQFYRPIFECRWNRSVDQYGHVLVQNGKIIGFIGAYYSSRCIHGKEERFCNLSAWMVREGHRNQSLLLLSPYLTLKEHTITGFTAAKHVYPIYRKSGFQDLEDKVVIIPLFSCLPKGLQGCEITSDATTMTRYLDANECRILADHQVRDCHHMLAFDKADRCYLVYTLTRKKGFKMAYLHYVGNKPFFAAHIGRITLAVFVRHQALFTCIERRHLPEPQPWIRKYYPLKVPRVFKSAGLEAKEVDSLYSELIAGNVFKRYFY